MSDLVTLSLEELEEELATLASHIYAGTCRWLELVGELDRRGDWADSGCGSCAEWLAWRCALLPRAAREHVRVARRLPELPKAAPRRRSGRPAVDPQRGDAAGVVDEVALAAGSGSPAP